MSIVEGVFHDLVASGQIIDTHNLPPSHPNIYWNYLNKIIRCVAKQFSFNDPYSFEYHLCPKPFEIVPFVRGTFYVYIPILACLNFKQIPVQFKTKDDQFDLTKAQDFSDWLCSDHYSLKKHKVKLIDLYKLRLFLKGVENYQEAKKAFLFSLGHELGHIYYRHLERCPFKQQMVKIFSIGISSLLKGRKQEKEADCFSYSKSAEFAEGGIYLLSLLNEGLKEKISDKIIHKFLNIGMSLSHTSCLSRLKAIQNHLVND